MTGTVFVSVKKWPMALGLVSVMGLAACDENGAFSLPTSEPATVSAPLPANAPNQRPVRDVDIERPDIFAITDDGLWDGRPSLGGVWVAHPEVTDPERVVIRNVDSGREIIGALFRRERENPGPLLQVSSDAAEALGMLPGSPTRIEVVVVRRAEVEAEEPANPVVESLEAPVTIQEEALDPATDTDDTDAAIAGAAVATTAVVLPAALEAATAAAEETAAVTATAADVVTETSETVDVSSVLETPDAVILETPEPVITPLPAGSMAQIGVFSVEANANSAAQTVTASGTPGIVTPEALGGRTVWRVTAGPLADTSAITQLKQLGFVDAFVIEAIQ